MLAAFKPEQVLAAFKPEQCLAGLVPEQRLASLAPEQAALDLSDEMLRALSDEYLSALPAATRTMIHDHIGG